MHMQAPRHDHVAGATRLQQDLAERRDASQHADRDDHFESLVEREEDQERGEEKKENPEEKETPTTEQRQLQQPPQDKSHSLILPRRPFKLRPETPAIASSTYITTTTTTPRNSSPYTRSHLRSRSSGAAFVAAPTMTRAHSSPSPSSDHDFLTPQSAAHHSHHNQQTSTLRTPVRQRSPFIPGEEYHHPRPRSPRSWEGAVPGIASIQEDVALDIPLSRPPLPLMRSGGSLRRSRPASPLHSVTNAAMTSGSAPSGLGADGSASPMLGPMQRHYSNEMYPSHSSTASSSLPGTPTSWMSRSRSPSISSLETIEDAGEEVEMKEAEAVERLREAADAEGRRSSFDGGSARLRSVGRERKRWSVCGGERRGDLDLETIWED